MNKLETLYKSIKGLQDMGLPLNEETLKAADELEEQLIESLRKIGLERIARLDITHGGYNLVGKDKRQVVSGRIWQHESDGWFIYSNINNSTKVEDLKRISDHFNLGLKIKEIKPASNK